MATDGPRQPKLGRALFGRALKHLGRSNGDAGLVKICQEFAASAYQPDLSSAVTSSEPYAVPNESPDLSSPALGTARGVVLATVTSISGAVTEIELIGSSMGARANRMEAGASENRVVAKHLQ